MSCSDTCLIAKSTFHFVQERETYSNARAKCQVLGGDLTTNTNQNAWRRLRECCQEQRQFWVGLHRCNGQDTYRSLDQPDSSCRVLPFTVPDRLINENCQALLMNPGITSGNYPERKLESCNIEHSYICQVRDVSETTSITTSITKTDATTNEAKEVFIERVNPDAKIQVQTTTPSENLSTNEEPNDVFVAMQSTTAASIDMNRRNQTSTIGFNVINSTNLYPVAQPKTENSQIAEILGGFLAVVVVAVLLAVGLHYRRRLRISTPPHEMNPSKNLSSNPRTSDASNHHPLPTSSGNNYDYIEPIATGDYTHTYVNFPAPQDQTASLGDPYEFMGGERQSEQKRNYPPERRDKRCDYVQMKGFSTANANEGTYVNQHNVEGIHNKNTVCWSVPWTTNDDENNGSGISNLSPVPASSDHTYVNTRDPSTAENNFHT
ncbi:unnamed protein product [Clavelina lepadiformis]|uniref:C-type lectin domain-containing protein n=1 Tax=Clavelina lepadiformis TaxID=159417 RepID=A0ABP0GS74_CLALP